ELPPRPPAHPAAAAAPRSAPLALAQAPGPGRPAGRVPQAQAATHLAGRRHLGGLARGAGAARGPLPGEAPRPPHALPYPGDDATGRARLSGVGPGGAV